MSIVTNEEAKSAMVAYLKTLTTLTSLLASANEIREVQYQGTEFEYPNVRVRIIENNPVGTSGCYHKFRIGIQVYSELESSREAEIISGIILEELNDRPFTQNSLNVIMRITDVVPALRVDERTWKSEVLATAVMS